MVTKRCRKRKIRVKDKMLLNEESQSLEADVPGVKSRGWGGFMKTVCTCVVGPMLTTCVTVWVLFVFVLKPSLQNVSLTSSTHGNVTSEPQALLLSQQQQPNRLYGRFTIQEALLSRLKNDSNLDETSYPKLNWTYSHTEDDTQSAFGLDHDGCVILPKTGYWFVHSEVTFVYGNSSVSNVWVYMRINNSTDMKNKKTITLPKMKYRSLRSHLPVDLTDVIYFAEHDTLCIEVSDWRIVYSSDADNSLALVYLPIG